MDRLADFLFEVGMLKRTPRTGWQFLGSGAESVAEHSFRVAMITFVLAHHEGDIDAERALRMALFHDLPEARTGDLNYMAQKYVTADEETAAADMTEGLPFGGEVRDLLAEFRAQESREAVLVRDADNLEMLFQLKEHHDVGNRNAERWMPAVVERLRLPSARELAQRVTAGDSSAWWFVDPGSDWWIRGGKV